MAAPNCEQPVPGLSPMVFADPSSPTGILTEDEIDSNMDAYLRKFDEILALQEDVNDQKLSEEQMEQLEQDVVSTVKKYDGILEIQLENNTEMSDSRREHIEELRRKLTPFLVELEMSAEELEAKEDYSVDGSQSSSVDKMTDELRNLLEEE